MRRIAIRADASVRLGAGHLMRCWALADELLARGAAVRFLCRDLPARLAGRLEAAGHEVVALAPPGVADLDEAGDAAATVAALGDGPWDWLVVDHYGLGAGWEAAARARAGRLLAIDDLARAHAADLVVNPSAPPGAPPAGAGGARTFLGPAFALLRPEFRGAAGRDLPAVPGRLRVNVCLGGSDPDGLAGRVLDALATLPADRLEVDLVIGALDPRADALVARCAGLANVRVHRDVTRLADLFRAADLGIGGGGGAALERCRAGLPSVIVCLADNQRPTRDALVRARAALPGGEAAGFRPEALAGLLARLLGRRRLLARMGRRAAAVLDGRGVERVAALLLGDDLGLREATAADVRLVWGWRNHPATRRFSLDDAPVAWATHRRWWADALARRGRALLLATCGGRDVGVLRLDEAEDGASATVSIFLDPGLHGLGLGPAVLRAGAAWVAARRPAIGTLLATILPANIGSRRAFAAAGYRLTDDPTRWRLDLGGAPGGRPAT